MEHHPPDRRLSVAPMLDWTDRHARAFHRCLTRHTLLYTEMVVCGAIIHGDRERHLGFSPPEHPLALQLGGSDPAELATCARIAADFGYDEINLNVGCPSDRVSAGRFGACLMAEPALVADCVAAMRGAVSLPVTVKHRLGIDHLDSYDLLCRFVETVRAAGCDTFIVHARKAWLSGLSPKENREIPPLRHDWVHALKRDYPDLAIVINGGLQTVEDAAGHLARGLDGAMIGRAAYETPYILAAADGVIYNDPAPPPDRCAVVERHLPYLAAQVARGVPLIHMTRHMLGLFHGQPGARAWRRTLGEEARDRAAGVAVVEKALAGVRAAAYSAASPRTPDGASTLNGSSPQ